MNFNKRLSATEIMDISLNVLKSHGPFADQHCERFNKIVIAPILVARAWEKLERDGLAYKTEAESFPNSKSIRYYITLDGVMAIENCPILFKGKPYKWKAAQKYITASSKVTVVIAVVINALIVLLFTYLTYIHG